MTQQQTPMKPSERGLMEIEDWAADPEDRRSEEEIIADSTGCDEALEMLRQLEWCSYRDSPESYVCYFCGEERSTHHAPDCRLAAYLKRYGESTMTDWNNIQVARNRVAETRKPPIPISVYPVVPADVAAGATWETAGDPGEQRYEFDCSSVPDGATVTKVDLGLGGKTIPVRFVNCKFVPPVQGGQGREDWTPVETDRAGNFTHGVMLGCTIGAALWVGLAYAVWPTLVKIW